MAKNKHFKVHPAARAHAVGVLQAWIARTKAKAQPRLFYRRLADEFGRGSYAIVSDDERLLKRVAGAWEEKLHKADIDAFTTGIPLDIKPVEKPEELDETVDLEESPAEEESPAPEGNGDLTCDVCGYVAKSKAGLAAHKRSHK